MKVLRPQPLTREAFAPFGDVIELQGAHHFPINGGSTQRFHDLARVDTAADGGRTLINLFRASARPRPLQLELMERHPLGSQAFIPLAPLPYVVVVAADEDGRFGTLQAFLTDGWQGVNYARNVWHHPLLSLHDDADFIVIDRDGEGCNLQECPLPEAVVVLLPD
jgi:ureidoglycolate lyase